MRLPGRELAFGSAGAVIVLALVLLPGIAGTGTVDWQKRHEAFYRLAAELGHRVAAPADAPEGASLIVLLGRGDGDPVLDGYVAETLASGGAVIYAGRPCPGIDAEIETLPTPEALEQVSSTVGGGALGEGVEDEAIFVSAAIFRDGLPEGARALLSTRAGPYAISASRDGGTVVFFADDELFADTEPLDEECAVLLDKLLTPYRGEPIAIDGDLGHDGRGILARAAVLPGILPVLAQAFALLLLAMGASAAARAGRRGSPPAATPSSLRTAEAVGGFYRKARASESADAVLAARFASDLGLLFGAESLADRGAGEAERSARIAALAWAASDGEDDPVPLMSASPDASPARLVEREARRAAMLARIYESDPGRKGARHGT